MMESPGSHDLPDTSFPDFPLRDPLEFSDFRSPFNFNHGETKEEILYRKLLSAACVGVNDQDEDLHITLQKYPQLVNRLDPRQNAAPLHFAAMNGHLNVVEFLLANGATVDIWNGERSITPLICACAHNRIEVAKYLIEHGADVNAGLNDPGADTSVLWAVRGGHTELVNYLIKEWKASQTSLVIYSETPIHAAVTSGCPEILRMLISEKGRADLTMRDGKDGKYTPLHLAASGEYPNALDCCKVLLEDCPTLNVNAIDSYDRTPLHLAGITTCPDPEIVRTLLLHGAGVDATDKMRRTPIFYFIRDSEHSLECIEILISQGQCDLNMQDKNGYTVLHLAAYGESLAAAEMLLINGADFSLKAEGAGGLSGLSLLLRRLPSTSSILHKALDNAVTLSGYDGKDHGAKPKQVCKVKVNYNYVVSSDPVSNCSPRKRKPYSSSVSDLVHMSRATHMENDATCTSGNHRKNAKIWAKGKLQDESKSPSQEEGRPFFSTKVHTNRKETSKIKCLIDERQSELLLHPVVHSFLSLKWQKARPIFIAIFAFKFLLVLLFSGYVHAPYYMGKEKEVLVRVIKSTANVSSTHVSQGTLPDAIPPWYIFLYSVIVLLATINGLMEIAQLIRIPKASFSSLEPFIFITVLVVMIFYTDPNTSWTKSDRCLHRTLTAAGIWLAWVDVWIYMGRFPAFGHSIRIFFTVLYNFAAFILPHFCLFIGFNMAFTLIFTHKFEFVDPLHTLAKSVRVMAGDITFPLEMTELVERNITTHTYITDSVIVYLYTAYVFTVGIVLMNLLIGLAVHDIQGIFKEASMHRLIKQTILLNTLESNFSGKWITLCGPMRFIQKHIALFHPSSHSKTLTFKPCDARDTKLSRDLKRALMKLKTDSVGGARGKSVSCDDLNGGLKTRSPKREHDYQATVRMEELVNRMEKMMRKLEARVGDPSFSPRVSFSGGP